MTEDEKEKEKRINKLGQPYRPRQRPIEADFDRRLGVILKNFRLFHGRPIREVAYSVDIAYQQMQKYESGTRIALSRFLNICEKMGWPWQEIILRALGQIDETAPYGGAAVGGSGLADYRSLSLMPENIPEEEKE